LNRCRTITVAAPEQIAAGRFDPILANILLEPLKTLAPAFASSLSANGILVLAGITTEQEPLLLERYSPQFNMRTVGRRETWTLMEGRSLQSARQEGR
jgi:ribosomal protein L11 methyltransferase